MRPLQVTLRMSNLQEIARAHAFARILGSLYTDGTAKCHKNSLEGRLILGHAIDAAQAAKDVELVTRKSVTITPPTEKDSYYAVRLPAWWSVSFPNSHIAGGPSRLVSLCPS